MRWVGAGDLASRCGRLPAAVAASRGCRRWSAATPTARVGAAGAAGAPPAAGGVRRCCESRLAWQVTLFFGLQAGGFYATLAWLPGIFRSDGASEAHAGVLLGLTMAVGLITALTLPGIAGRSRDQRPLVIASCWPDRGRLDRDPGRPDVRLVSVGGVAWPGAERGIPARADADRAARWQRRHNRGALHLGTVGRLRPGGPGSAGSRSDPRTGGTPGHRR